MNKKHSTCKDYLFLSGLLVSASVALTACGGGGSGGGEQPVSANDSSNTDFSTVKQATVTSTEDAAEVAYAATEGVYQGISSSNLGGSLPAGGIVSEYDVREALARDAREVASAVQSTSGLPVGATTSVAGDCGGSLTINTGDEQAPQNGTASYNYTYDNYCISLGDGSQYIVDGTGDYSFTNDNGQLTQYSVSWDVTYRITGAEPVTSRVSGTTTCTLDSSTYSCTYSDDFTGPNGETYRVENVSVTPNSGDGTYDVGARVYDTDVGYVDFSASSIGQCADGNFNSGTITITDSTGAVVVTVSFFNCDECVVEFNNDTQTYPQPDRT